MKYPRKITLPLPEDLFLRAKKGARAESRPLTSFIRAAMLDRLEAHDRIRMAALRKPWVQKAMNVLGQRVKIVDPVATSGRGPAEFIEYLQEQGLSDGEIKDAISRLPTVGME